VHIEAWYINTYYDPGVYTQTAHRDAATVTDAQGHRSQARAFVDAQGHIDIVVVPDDPSKTRIFAGPALTNIDDPQHRATVTVTAHGTIVTVLVQGPLVADWFAANRQSEQWAADISQQPSSKGGK
jgi:hypothetical protein